MTSIKSMLKHTFDTLLFIPLLLIAGTVLVVNREMVSPTVAGKYAWYACSLLLLIITCLLSFIIHRKRVKVSLADILITILCFWGIGITYYLQDLFSIKLYFLLSFWILYMISRISIAQKDKNANLLLFALMLTGLIEAIWGLSQLYNFSPSQHRLFKTTGSFYNSGPYAGYLATILPIAFHYLLADYTIIKSKFELSRIFPYVRWITSLITFTLIISILPATMSRASWIASFIACIFIVISTLLDKYQIIVANLIRKHRRKFRIASVVMALLLLTSLFAIYLLKKDSADGRFLIWKNSLSVLRKHPEGVGIGSFSKYYGEEQIEYFISGNATEQEKLVAGSPEYAFNEYLQIGIEFGIIPLLVFLYLIGYILYKGYKLKNYPALGALVSLLIFASMSYPLNLLPFIIILVLLIVLSLNKCDISKVNKSALFLTTITIIICSLFIIYFGIIKYYPMNQSYREWQKLVLLNNLGIPQKQAEGYKKLLPHLGHESRFLFEYAQCLNQLKQYNESNLILGKMAELSCDPMLYNIMGRNFQDLGDYEKAEKAFKTASLLIPSRIYPYYLLTKLYDKIGEKDKALLMAQIVQTKEPKVHSKAIEEMREETHKIFEKYKDK